LDADPGRSAVEAVGVKITPAVDGDRAKYRHPEHWEELSGAYRKWQQRAGGTDREFGYPTFL
jgi:hypothetical protein